jgi:hypothetical protein
MAIQLISAVCFLTKHQHQLTAILTAILGPSALGKNLAREIKKDAASLEEDCILDGSDGPTSHRGHRCVVLISREKVSLTSAKSLVSEMKALVG